MQWAYCPIISYRIDVDATVPLDGFNACAFVNTKHKTKSHLKLTTRTKRQHILYFRARNIKSNCKFTFFLFCVYPYFKFFSFSDCMLGFIGCRRCVEYFILVRYSHAYTCAYNGRSYVLRRICSHNSNEIIYEKKISTQKKKVLIEAVAAEHMSVQ